MTLIRFIWPGKTKESWLKQGIEYYLKRLKNYYQVNVIETRAARYSAENKAKVIQTEGTHIQKVLNKDRGFLVALDVRGKEMSSEKLADFLKNKQDQGINVFNFVIGGAYGLAPEITQKANLLLSLSKMTFTHEMSRLILAEQLYRAASINVGSPYHH